MRPSTRLPLSSLAVAPCARIPVYRRVQALPLPHISCRKASSSAALVDTIPGIAQNVDKVTHMLRIPMEYMHDTLHIPWLWVIPLSALAIRAILYYPITLSTRKALQRRLAISPLINAHKSWYLKDARNHARHDPSVGMMKRYRTAMRALRKDLQHRFDCGLGKTLLRPILQLPVFLTMSWNIREMLGIPGGTLKSLLYTMLGQELTEGMDAARQAALLFEPTMMEEGLPWAVDLTIADPTGTLSYAVSAIMMSQTLLSMRRVPGGSGSVLTRFLLVLSLAIGPLMVNAPAGLLYYWACSSGMALITNVILDWRYPLLRFTPCKRPLTNPLPKK
ncbi:uncharacterized protein PV09_03725 [Verruconis gallopava]|uniref:Uncharacterized protein n=1 Tax=Verruconis gallopava TaxID=253628 RepID=A0A0D1XR52_9PEZI|nr:uncharacterized protein PV09_03725 [Verruconis gallopava]KIW05176.1 hypothetical protein PV09_03725 [Verruconis gallopava]